MKESSEWLTPKQASELIDKSARHIQQLITDGKLSATKEDGRYYISKSEFFRVYPKAHRKEVDGNIALKEAEANRLHSENELLRQMTSQKDKEIEFLRNQIEYVSQEKLKMLDTIVSHTRLLEHKKSQEEPSQKNEESAEKKWSWRTILGKKKE